jgi:hypothetical protein
MVLSTSRSRWSMRQTTSSLRTKSCRSISPRAVAAPSSLMSTSKTGVGSKTGSLSLISSRRSDPKLIDWQSLISVWRGSDSSENLTVRREGGQVCMVIFWEIKKRRWRRLMLANHVVVLLWILGSSCVSRLRRGFWPVYWFYRFCGFAFSVSYRV